MQMKITLTITSDICKDSPLDERIFRVNKVRKVRSKQEDEQMSQNGIKWNEIEAKKAGYFFHSELNESLFSVPDDKSCRSSSKTRISYERRKSDSFNLTFAHFPFFDSMLEK